MMMMIENRLCGGLSRVGLCNCPDSQPLRGMTVPGTVSPLGVGTVGDSCTRLRGQFGTVWGQFRGQFTSLLCGDSLGTVWALLEGPESEPASPFQPPRTGEGTPSVGAPREGGPDGEGPDLRRWGEYVGDGAVRGHAFLTCHISRDLTDRVTRRHAPSICPCQKLTQQVTRGHARVGGSSHVFPLLKRGKRDL